MSRGKSRDVFVIYCDAYGASGYFIRFDFGGFWQCGIRAEAHEFQTRAAAVTVLHNTGKHLLGWRVLRSVPRDEVRRLASPDLLDGLDVSSREVTDK